MKAAKHQRPWNPSRGYIGFLVPPALLLIIFFLWPLLLVIVRSIAEPSLGLGNFATALSSSLYWRVFAKTFEVAATVTLITLVLAYPVAWAITRARGSLFNLCVAIVVIPFWTSVVVRTFAWMVLFQRHGVLNEALVDIDVFRQPVQLLGTSVGMHIGMVHILLPFMILPLFNVMRGIDPVLLRSASVLGANPFRQFWHVFLPLSAPGVGAGCLLVFISALGFYVTPALLGGPRDMTIAVLIEQQATQLLNWPMASTLSTLLLIATAILYFVYERLAVRLNLRGPFAV